MIHAIRTSRLVTVPILALRVLTMQKVYFKRNNALIPDQSPDPQNDPQERKKSRSIK